MVEQGPHLQTFEADIGWEKHDRRSRQCVAMCRQCVACKRHLARPLNNPAPEQLPEFRVAPARPLQSVVWTSLDLSMWYKESQ